MFNVKYGYKSDLIFLFFIDYIYKNDCMWVIEVVERRCINSLLCHNSII